MNTTYPFAVPDEEGNPRYFTSLPKDIQDRITQAPLVVYVCEGLASDIDKWFKTINIAGVPLNDQERLNATYHGPFVTAARSEFSNSQNAHMHKWLTYIKGDPKRQEVFAEALKWVSHGSIQDYMSRHRNSGDISELKNHFDSVMDWAGNLFDYTGDKIRGLPWGEFYDKYHDNAYDKKAVNRRVSELLADPCVYNSRGIFEYILGGETATQLLDVRVFDEPIKRSVYEKQTTAAKKKGVSNCPLCAVGHEANAARIWKLSEMDADHVSAWSKGGATSAENCQMLCKTHNRAKGNR